MRRTRWASALAVGIIAAVVLAACGSDDKATSSSAPTTASTTSAAATTAAGATTAASTATTAASATTSGATTASTPAGGGEQVDPGSKTPPPAGVGLIDGVYKGTSGFELDPADCPGDWDPAQGISDSEINLFISLPTSGPLAGFGLAAEGAKAYFKHVNDTGGIDGRSIILDSKDDGYQPDKTKTNVDEAMGSGKYAALYATLGTPNNLAIWDATNDECMPQLLNGTGAAQWGDVEGHPWTSGMQLDYFTEASLWATWLQHRAPGADQGRRADVQQRLRPELPPRLRLRHPGHRHRGRRPGDARADRAEPRQPVRHAGGQRRRGRAAGDVRGVLHPGDGQHPEAARAGSRW